MTYPGGGGFFDGPLGDLFGETASRPSGPKPAFTKKEEKGVPWEAKIIDGQYYIPLKQVADLLKENDVLPKVRAGIERRVEKGPPGPVRAAGYEKTDDKIPSASERMDDINSGYRRGPND